MKASRFKIVLIASAVTILAAPAWACRGTHEYPEAGLLLARADLPASEKATLQKRLDEGAALHERGHAEDSMEMRKESLRILDEIRARLAK